MDGWIDAWMQGRMDAKVQPRKRQNQHAWMDGWIDAWMQGCIDAKVQPRERQNQHFVVVNSGRLQGQNNGFLVFVAALSMLREPFGKGQWNRF